MSSALDGVLKDLDAGVALLSEGLARITERGDVGDAPLAAVGDGRGASDESESDGGSESDEGSEGGARGARGESDHARAVHRLGSLAHSVEVYVALLPSLPLSPRPRVRG